MKTNIKNDYSVADFNCIVVDLLSSPLLPELPEHLVHQLFQTLPKKMKHALY